jgi:hypothetical protein
MSALMATTSPAASFDALPMARRAPDDDPALRRVDWRLLLPPAALRRVALFAGVEGAGGIALLAQGVVDGPAAEPGDSSLALVGDVRRATLAAAYRALEPGGSLYLEVPGAAGRQRRAVLDALGAAGFEILGRYVMVTARNGLRRAWLPVGSPGAIGHFLSVGKGRRARSGPVRRRARSAVWRLRAGGFLPARFAVVARRTPASANADSPAGTDLLGLVRERWDELGLGGAAERCSLLLLAPGRSMVNKLIGTVFQEPDPRPLMVVKMPRVAESNPFLRNEAHVLKALAGGPTPVTGIPEILFSIETRERVLVAQSFMGGRPLSGELRAASAPRIAARVTDWLVALATRQRTGAAADRAGTVVASILDRFAQEYGRVVDPAFLRASEELLRPLDVLPVVCEQRDFSPWNLRITDAGELVVLDWESAVLEGLPLLDLLYFLSYLAFRLDRAEQPQQRIRSLRRMWDPRTPSGRIAAECVARYVAAVGIPASAVAPLRVLLWMVHSHSEFQQLRRKHGPPPEAAALRSGLFLRLWDEEIRFVLEGPGPAEAYLGGAVS